MMTDVKRGAAFVAGWVVLTALAVVMAWQGVRFAQDEVTGERRNVLTAADIQEALAPAATATTTAGTSGRSTSSTTSASGSTATTGGTTPSVTAPTTAATSGSLAPVTRTYTMVGGTAQIRFTATSVTIVYARPAAGFEIDDESEDGTTVRVRFRSDTHESRLEAWWDGGPHDSVQEKADSSGDG